MRTIPRRLITVAFVSIAWLHPAAARAQVQIQAKIPAGITPPWNKGIQPISSESYYSAIACGKQGGANPPCVFYDTGLCRNDDFVVTLYTPYKQVAYEVWQAVSHKQPAPTPNYAAAQRTRVTIGITPAAGSKNAIAAVVVKRGGATLRPATQSLDSGGGRFIFDPAAFAPTTSLTLELSGRQRTVICTFDRAALARMR